MTLQPIVVPATIGKSDLSDRDCQLIDAANDRIESLMLSNIDISENYVNCDFHLVAKTLAWIDENHLMSGGRFCELGSGLGVVSMLAAGRGWESVGIEIQSQLVRQSDDFAEQIGNHAKFLHGSFIPRGLPAFEDLAADVQHVDTHEDDVYAQIGHQIDSFDLFFAFPWPGEHDFFEAIVDRAAATGTLLLTYRGREGMHLSRKID